MVDSSKCQTKKVLNERLRNIVGHVMEGKTSHFRSLAQWGLLGGFCGLSEPYTLNPLNPLTP